MIEKKYKNTFIVLFSIVIVLLVLELIVEKLYPGTKDKPLISYAEADSVLVNVLNDFGFRTEWYKKKADAYYVTLPDDLPSELVMLELREYLKDKDFKVESSEVIKGSNSVMKLYSGGDKVLSVFFSYDKTKKRHTSEISFLLLNPDKLSESEKTELLKSQDKFAAALYPSKTNRDFAGALANNGKEYVIIINDDIDELEYRLDDKFSDKKLLITIQTIISQFSQTAFYIIDDESELSARVVSILQKEMSKRNIKHYPLSHFTVLSDFTDGQQLESVLNSYSDKNEIFVVEAGSYIVLKDDIKYLRKKGFRIVPL